jgi:hypothetical protein
VSPLAAGASSRGVTCRWGDVSDLFPLRTRLPAEPRVRLRCDPCEVAWSGPRDSSCWVCGSEGAALHPTLAGREHTVSAFDLDLLV